MGCLEDDDCPSDKKCDLMNKQCVSPCYICGLGAGKLILLINICIL
jgi:hypothetical protein